MLRHFVRLITQCLPAQNIGGFIRFLTFDGELISQLSSPQTFVHACQTPLTTALCSLELLLNTQDMSVRSKKRLLRANQAIFQLRELVELLRKEDSEETQFQKFPIAVAIAEVTTLLKQNSSVITVNCLQRLDFYLTGNKLYFQEVLSCLIKNALEAYGEDIRQRRVDVVVKLSKNQLQIQVIDYAEGMNYWTQALACVRGLSTKASGHGIGLAFAKQAVEKLFSGVLIIDSHLGIGTRVVISLPIPEQNTQNL